MCLSMDLWHSSNMKVVLQKFAMDHCFWTLWTLNYVNYIPFSCINSFHMAHNKPNNFKENFILEFSEKHDQTSSLWKGSHKNSPIHLSIYSSARLWCIFLRIYSVEFLYFFAWGYFAIYTKKGQIQILENSICCLDNWVNKTNLDQKQKMWHFNKDNIIFCQLNETS